MTPEETIALAKTHILALETSLEALQRWGKIRHKDNRGRGRVSSTTDLRADPEGDDERGMAAAEAEYNLHLGTALRAVDGARPHVRGVSGWHHAEDVITHALTADANGECRQFHSATKLLQVALGEWRGVATEPSRIAALNHRVDMSETVALARRRLDILEHAGGMLEMFRRHMRDSKAGAASGDHDGGARTTYDFHAAEVTEALADVNIDPIVTILHNGTAHRVHAINDALLIDKWDWLAHAEATALIDRAEGKWEAIRDDPARYAKREHPAEPKEPGRMPDDLAELKATVAKLQADVDDLKKPAQAMLRQHWLTLAGFVLAGTAIILTAAGIFYTIRKSALASELAGARAKVVEDLVPVKTSVAALESRVTRLEDAGVGAPEVTQKPEPRAAQPVAEGACPVLPAYKQLGCIETSEGVKQPNTMLAKIPREDSQAILDAERLRLRALFRKHDRFESWSAHFQILSNGSQRQLVLTQVHPDRAYELCQWLDVCDRGKDRLDQQLRSCTAMNTVSGAKTCRASSAAPADSNAKPN